MAQDWITTLDHDLGGLHPESAASIKRFLESLRTCFRGDAAPTDPVKGQMWCDTSGSDPVWRTYDGASWRNTQTQPALTAPVEGVTRSAAFDGSGNGDAVRLETISELVTVADAATTATTIEIPAGARVRAVAIRVVTQPPGTTSVQVGITGTATRFLDGISTVADTTAVSAAELTRFASATALLLTPNGPPSDDTGRIRVVVHYEIISAPTA